MKSGNHGVTISARQLLPRMRPPYWGSERTKLLTLSILTPTVIMLKMAKALDLEVPKALFVGGKADMNPHLVRSVSRKNQDFLQACCRSDSYIADALLPALFQVFWLVKTQSTRVLVRRMKVNLSR